MTADTQVDFETHPDRYRHWRLEASDRVARLVLDTDEHGGLRPGYELKLNSYDLGVDIELYDALQRLRFEQYEPGRFASWITPPNVGINDRSIDFPYVRLG